MMKLGYAIVFASNMDRSVAFYRDVLGFPVKFASPEWTEFATEGTILALHPAAVANPDSSPPAQTPGGRCQLGFGTNDIDLFHSQMLAQGVPCVRPPTAEHGTKLAVYIDPDGLPFTIGQNPQQSVTAPQSEPTPEAVTPAPSPPEPPPAPPASKPAKAPRPRIVARSSPKRRISKPKTARRTKAHSTARAKKTNRAKPRRKAKSKVVASGRSKRRR